MYFFIDEEKKIIFGWNPKCGSNHMIKLFTFLTGRIIHPMYMLTTEFPINHSDYKIILVMRNPFDRIVSAYRFLYKKDGYCICLWKTDKRLTFRNFVDELDKNGTTTIIDKYHFNPQLTHIQPCNSETPFRNSSFELPENVKIDQIYDLSNINYTYIETLYGKEIPNEIRMFTGKMVNATKLTSKLGLSDALKGLDEHEIKVYDMDDEEIQLLPHVSLSQFYNQDIATKVAKFYRLDLEFIKKHLPG
jgi:hypothetical protein